MTNKSLRNLSKAEQRKQRLLEAEAELALEESDALTMTEEQRRILAKSFLLVKTEFSDLDGLRWTQNALREFQSRWVTPRTPESGNNALSNSESPSLSSDNTIRIASFSVNPSVQPRAGLFAQLPCRNRDGSRPRSSVLGLFAACPSTYQCNNNSSLAL